MQENDVNIKEYLEILKKRIWVIIIFPILFAVISAILSTYFLNKVYEAKTTLYIVPKVSSEAKDSLAYNDLLMGQVLVKDFREIIKQRIILKEVLNDLKIDNSEYDSILSSISINLKNDTRVLEIKVEDGSAQRAALLANKISEVFGKKIVDIMKIESINVLDVAEKPQKPVKPNLLMNVFAATIIGLLFAVGLVFLIEFFDNTVKNSQDVEKHLGLTVIGTIPMFEDYNPKAVK